MELDIGKPKHVVERDVPPRNRTSDSVSLLDCWISVRAAQPRSLLQVMQMSITSAAMSGTREIIATLPSRDEHVPLHIIASQPTPYLESVPTYMMELNGPDLRSSAGVVLSVSRHPNGGKFTPET